MRERRSQVQTMGASEARENFSQLLNTVFRGETRILIEKSGIPVAAIISAEDLKELTRLEEQIAQRFTLLRRLRAAFVDRSEEQIESDVASVIARVREGERADAPSPHQS